MFSADSLIPMLFRFIHLVSGAIWISQLYHFNLIQAPFMKEVGALPRRDAVLKLVPRSLFWFRWSAVVTLLAGIGLMAVGHFRNPSIMIGSTLGLIMFLNTWIIILPNQKAVIRMTTEAVEDKMPISPEVDLHVQRVFWISRFNFWLSFPMLFFMGASSHFSQF